MKDSNNRTLLHSFVDEHPLGQGKNRWEFRLSLEVARRVEFIDEVNWAHPAIQRGVRSAVEAILYTLPMKFRCRLDADNDPRPDTCAWEILKSLQFAVRVAWEGMRQEQMLRQ